MPDTVIEAGGELIVKGHQADWWPHYYCPHCGKPANPGNARLTGRCIHCGQPVHMLGEEVKS